MTSIDWRDYYRVERKRLPVRVGLMTLVGVLSSNYPLRSGNRFSFASDEACLNMCWENLKEWARRAQKTEVVVDVFTSVHSGWAVGGGCGVRHAVRGDDPTRLEARDHSTDSSSRRCTSRLGVLVSTDVVWMRELRQRSDPVPNLDVGDGAGELPLPILRAGVDPNASALSRNTMTITDWLELRRADILAREGERSLVTVDGVTKHLGSWGFPSFEEAQAYIETVVPLPPKCYLAFEDAAGGVFVYLYDPQSLPLKLEAASDLLRRNGWPVNADEFIHHQRAHMAQPFTPLYDFIADLYGDTTNPGLSSNTNHELALTRIRRYFEVYEEPDPATAFFALTKTGRRILAKFGRNMGVR